MGPLALACLSSCFSGCGAQPARGAQPAAERQATRAPDVGVVFVGSLPWLEAPPELGRPGEIHIATDASWELYEEAGGQQQEGSVPHSVFSLTPDRASIAIEPSLAGSVAGFHRDPDGDRDAWHFAVRLFAAGPGEGGSSVPPGLSLVRVDRAGTVVARHPFGSAFVHEDLMPLALGSEPMVVRRPLEYPGGGGGLLVQLGPSYPDDLVSVRWCEPDCHTPLALLTREEQLLVVLLLAGAPERPIQLGAVTREGVREARPVSADPSSQACENAVYTHDGDTARARVPTAVDQSVEFGIEGARWLPGPNTHPHELDVCVEDGALRVRLIEGAWISVADGVDPEGVWVSCDGRRCVSVFARTDGIYQLARFAM
jgi:hypothetical protein